MASGDHAPCKSQLRCSVIESDSPRHLRQYNGISSSQLIAAHAQPSCSTAAAHDAPELLCHSSAGHSFAVSTDTSCRTPEQQKWCPSGTTHSHRDSTPCSRRTATQRSHLTRRCFTPQPVHDMSISESSSDSSYSDDYAELRRRWCSQEDLSVKSPLESSELQLPLDNYDGTTCSTPLQHTPVSVWQLQSSQPSISPISLDSPGPRFPYYDPHVPPPPLAMQSPRTVPKMPFYNPHIPPPSLSASSSSSPRDSSKAVPSSLASSWPSRQDSFGAVLSSSQTLPLSSAQSSSGVVPTPSQTFPLSSTGNSSEAMPSLVQTSSLSSTWDSFGAVLSSQTSPRPSRQDSFGAVLSSSQVLPLSSAQGSFGAVQTPSQTSPLSSTGGTSRTMPSLLQTSPSSSTWDSGAAMEPAQVKRVTDEEWPLVKRSRSGPDAGDGFARLSGTQPHVFRGGLQWRGPSTYRMYCMQQDEGGDKDRQVLDMFCYQEEDTAEVVFRPKFLTPTSQPATPMRAKRSQRQLSRWAPRSASTPSSEMALTTAPNMPLLSKRWPYSVPPKVGLVDSHCHLDFIFSRVGHTGTYAKFRLKHRDTFPDCYEGCVANFCNPQTFKLRHMWGSLLAEDGVWGAFGCHPHMASEYNNDIEDDLVYALDHPSVVALGEIGLDYSYKNQCDRDVQKAVFRKQLKLALNRKLPLVIHSRDSTQDTIDILKELVPRDYLIHRHCFTGGWPEAQEWLGAFPNLCLGITPLICFERTGYLAEVGRKIPLDRLLLETDAPYFLPKEETKNLRVSHPGMAIHVAARVSMLQKASIEDVLTAARNNTKRIYGI